MISIDITIESAKWNNEKMLYNITENALVTTLQHLSLNEITSELSLLFTDDTHMAQINARWRNHNKPTNVLSFPAFPLKAGQNPKLTLGDIVIAQETVMREAEEEKKSFQDHLTHIIIHGILHLLGYDHQTNDEANQMEKLEKEILQKLTIKDPYTKLL
ncbi:MAG: rRNA maturation RNase YbeY [Bartonella sp.]|nr:rRNA maturation RNase YbeY [Bartonella sp.]